MFRAVLDRISKPRQTDQEATQGQHGRRLSASEVDQRIRSLELKAQRLSQQRLFGRYRSRFKGRGIEFRDFREYLPGDDVRTIDWNVTARFGRPFVRNSEEERELSVLLLLDLSPSQQFGSGSETKGELAQQLATLLALAAAASGDKIGLLVMDGQHYRYLAPAKGRHQKQRVLQTIWQPLEQDPRKRDGNFVGALEDIDRWLRRRSFLCLISDFLLDSLLKEDNTQEVERLLSVLRKLSFRHEVMAFRTFDKRERHLPDTGTVVLRDLRDGRTVRLDTSHGDWRQGLARKWVRWDSIFGGLMKRSRWDWADFQTDQDPLPPLANFLDARGRHRR